jgi:beta-glucosidase
LAENADAILCAWNPGMEGGRAIAEILFGDVNPSAKLTLSWPAHVGQQPVFYNQLPGWHGGRYADMRSSPQWPFGHGLSYTSFEYGELRTNGVRFAAMDTIEVLVDVTNTGERAGAEIVQLYVNDLVSSVTTPIKQLKGFVRVELEAGETRSVRLELPVSELWLIDAACEKVVEPGEFEIMVGPSSSDDALLRTIISVEEG